MYSDSVSLEGVDPSPSFSILSLFPVSVCRGGKFPDNSRFFFSSAPRFSLRLPPGSSVVLWTPFVANGSVGMLTVAVWKLTVAVCKTALPFVAESVAVWLPALPFGCRRCRFTSLAEATLFQFDK